MKLISIQVAKHRVDEALDGGGIHVKIPDTQLYRLAQAYADGKIQQDQFIQEAANVLERNREGIMLGSYPIYGRIDKLVKAIEENAAELKKEVPR